MGGGVDGYGTKLASLHGHAVLADVEGGAHSPEGGQGGDQPVLLAAGDPDAPTGGQAGRQVGESFDAVPAQALPGAVKVGRALDDVTAVRPHLDPGAHALEEQGQLDHLGLDGGIVQHRAAFGHRRGEQHRLGGAHARERQADAGALEPGGLGLDDVVGHVDLGAEGAERVEVEVQGPPTDGVSAREGHDHVTEPVQQGADHEDRYAVEARVPDGHGAGVHPAGVDGHAVALLGDAGADRGQHARGDLDVPHPGGVEDPAGRVGQQRGHHQLGDGVLRARHLHLALQGSGGLHLPDNLVFGGHRPILPARRRRSVHAAARPTRPPGVGGPRAGGGGSARRPASPGDAGPPNPATPTAPPDGVRPPSVGGSGGWDGRLRRRHPSPLGAGDRSGSAGSGGSPRGSRSPGTAHRGACWRPTHASPACSARTSTVSKMRAVAASIMVPPRLAAPAPAVSASRTAATTARARSISWGVGE